MQWVILSEWTMSECREKTLSENDLTKCSMSMSEIGGQWMSNVWAVSEQWAVRRACNEWIMNMWEKWAWVNSESGVRSERAMSETSEQWESSGWKLTMSVRVNNEWVRGESNELVGWMNYELVIRVNNVLVSKMSEISVHRVLTRQMNASISDADS